EALRERARQIKAHALAHLPYYLEQLEAEVRATGGHVHWARDGAEACGIILDIARRHGVRTVVKSKSMTTEEIELNHVLEHDGIQVTETDLGEFILQLIGEKPGHILGPAIHKTKEQVAEVFSQHLGIPRYDQPEQLTMAARTALRHRFLQAGMGISGVNFGVAETGTIVVVENEGNARLTTSLPKVHVAVMGMEKVIPTMADLITLMRVLARSATGQTMPVYASLINGPRRAGEADGPDEFHLVILDNGRTRILADPEMRESLQCIRCGACLNVCPVYQRTAGHPYGSVYSGPIGAVITPLYLGIDRAAQLPFASSLCGACGEVCPVKIDIPRLLVTLRARAVAAGHAPAAERWSFRLWQWAMERSGGYALGGRLMRRALRLFERDGKVSSLPFPFSQWTQSRDFPAPPAKSFRERWREVR
ncbi:MAG: iron-sulfur cluster-binding protein, partial [Armatimonadetes bacterium]|nr:iron-sulfur cluster-binding protein [Armatimonadota bacterium]